MAASGNRLAAISRLFSETSSAVIRADGKTLAKCGSELPMPVPKSRMLSGPALPLADQRRENLPGQALDGQVRVGIATTQLDQQTLGCPGGSKSGGTGSGSQSSGSAAQGTGSSADQKPSSATQGSGSSATPGRVFKGL